MHLFCAPISLSVFSTMLTKNDLQVLSDARISDALYLYQVCRSSSAYYLAGYSVELAIKACVAKSFRPDSIPDKAYVQAIYTHNLDALIKVAGLWPQFGTDSMKDPRLAAAWGIASKWT